MMVKGIVNTSAGTQAGFSQRCITRTSDGVLHDVYHDTNILYHKSSSDDGETWGSAHTIRNSGNTTQFVVIGVDSNDKLHVAWHELIGGKYDLNYSTSPDGGVTWAGPTTVWDGSALGYDCRFPSLAVDHADDIHIVCMTTPGGIESIAHKYWSAGWSAETNPPVAANQQQWYPQVAIYSDNRAQVAWYGEKVGFVNRWGVRTATFTKGAGFGGITDVEFEAAFNLEDVRVIIDGNDDWWISYTTRLAGWNVYKVETSGAKSGTTTGVAANITRHNGTLARDRNNNIYLIWQNTVDDELEYKRLDYAADTWGSIIELDTVGSFGIAYINAINGNAPGDQNILPENGIDDLGVVYKDGNDLIYKGVKTWNPDGFPREVHVLIDNGTGTITYRENEASFLMDWEYEPNENESKRVMLVIDNSSLDPAVNLLNSSCAQWSSGTAALKMGDLIRLGLYQSDDTTVDVLFDGVITEVPADVGGILTVVAHDPSERLKHTKPIFTHGATYLDELVRAVTVAGSIRYIGSVTESDIVEPMVKVAFAHTDTKLTLSGTNDNFNAIQAVGNYVEQAFLAESDHFIGVEFRWGTDWTIGSQANLDISIFTDDDNSPGNLLQKEDVFLQQGIDTSPTTVDFTTSDTPLRLVKGQKYWIRIAEDGISVGGGTHFSIVSKDTALTYWMDEFYHELGGLSAIPNELLDIKLAWANYEELEGADFWFDDTANRIYLLKINDVVSDIAGAPAGGSYYTIKRGLTSYYYGTITKEQLCERLITANTGLLKNLSANLDRTFGVYSTRGKSMHEALKEVMDVAEDSGSWDGFQSVMMHYLDGSDINRLKVSKRKKTTDSATYILSHPSDRSKDDEHIIIGDPNIKITNKRNYARVTVTGRGYDGDALVVTRSDESKSGGFWAQMSGIAETLKVTDENQTTLSEVDKRAYALLDAIQRNVWQGSIMLDGQHEDMFDWDPTSDTYGSGNIITMYWGPLGISNVKMKVTGMVLRKLDTEVYVNNVDTLLDNKLTRGWNESERSASFISPVGVPEVVYGFTYTGTIITTAVLWMELCDSGGTALPSQNRQLCTRFSNTDYNQIVYHAEFGPGNGHIATIGGVGQIKLYTTKTGSSPSETIDLTKTESSIVIDEEVDKFKQSKLIFEVLADAS